MRRTTQWAVFTSMNQQQPAHRSSFEPSERAERAGVIADSTNTAPQQAEPESRTAPDTRRDRVDLM